MKVVDCLFLFIGWSHSYFPCSSRTESLDTLGKLSVNVGSNLDVFIWISWSRKRKLLYLRGQVCTSPPPLSTTLSLPLYVSSHWIIGGNGYLHFVTIVNSPPPRYLYFTMCWSKMSCPTVIFLNPFKTFNHQFLIYKVNSKDVNNSVTFSPYLQSIIVKFSKMKSYFQ